MKFFVFVLFLCMVIAQSFGQSRPERLGMREFQLFNYAGAIGYLERVDNKSTDVNRKLAQSHFFLGDTDASLRYYAAVSVSDEKTSADLWEYAQALMTVERYPEAVKQLEALMLISPGDSRAHNYLQAGDFAADLKKNSSNIDVRHLKINGQHQDFGPMYYRDQIVFATTRETGLPKRGLWEGNKLPFIAPFIADKASDGELLNPRPLLPSMLMREFHVGPVAINKQEDVMAVTVNYGLDKKFDKTVNLQLLISYFTDGKWGDLQPAPFNNPEYSVGHASFTPDGKIMYFASDMPGGKGGTDIYKVSVLESGQWSSPENIAAINTEGNEMFPFYHEDNVLIFASDGHAGLGGLDIFYASLTDGKPGDVINMGYPINSSQDDFSLIIDNDYKTGYFASKRGGSSGNDDLYYFSLKEPLIEAPAEEPVIAVVPQPQPQPQPQPLPGMPEPQPVLKPGENIQINPIFFDFDKSFIRTDAAAELDKIVRIMNDNPGMFVELGSHTDCRGTDSYNEMLSKARMNATVDYIRHQINRPERISGVYYGKTRLINRCDCEESPPCSDREHQENRRSEFKIISM